VSASRSPAARKVAPPAPSRARSAGKTAPRPTLVETTAPEPAILSAPRPGQARHRDFSASIYLAARPFCLTRPSAVPQAPMAAPADHLVRTPQDIAIRLGQMPIELAAPMLRANLVALDAQALLTLVATTGEAHHAVIATRRDLDWRVVKAIIRAGFETALLALAENHTIAFDDEDRVAMSRHAERLIMVRGALLSRPGFAFASAMSKLNADDGLAHANLRLVKLARAGRHAIFIREAARRLHVAATGLAAALTASPDVSLALITCALDMDRAVFTHVLSLWRANHGLPDPADAPHKTLLLSIFALAPDEAHRKLAAGLPSFA